VPGFNGRQSVGDEPFELLDGEAHASANADRCELVGIHELIDHERLIDNISEACLILTRSARVVVSLVRDGKRVGAVVMSR